MVALSPLFPRVLAPKRHVAVTRRAPGVLRALRALVLVAAGLGACGPRPSTQVDVVVDADPAIRAETALLRITIDGHGADGETHVVFDEAARFPLTTAITPAFGDDRRTFSFEVLALDENHRTIVGARITSGFTPHVRVPPLVIQLEAACRGVVCPPGSTCRAGLCVDERIVPMADAGTDASSGAADAGPTTIDAWANACTDCDDGLTCNGIESCVAGSCAPGEPVECVPDACDESATCEEPTGSCVHVPRDADLDSFGDAACGGPDCDDTRADANPSATELCNDVDDDCDFRVDEDASCPAGTTCLARGGSSACRSPVCGDGFTEAPELCDHGGDAARPDGCSATCAFDDTCSSPIDLDVVGTRTASRLSYRFSTVGAVPLASPSCAFADGPDRLFVVRAPAASFTVRTLNNNTALAVLRGAGCAGAELGCSEDDDGVRPVVGLGGLTVGEPLTIVVDQHYDTWGSSQTLQLDFP